MKTRRAILRILAPLAGGAALADLVHRAWREFRYGESALASPVILIPAALAGLFLLYFWRREAARDPALVPAYLFATAAFLYFLLLPDRLNLYRFGLGPGSSWLTLAGAAGAFFVIMVLSGCVSSLVFHGTLLFFRSVVQNISGGRK